MKLPKFEFQIKGLPNIFDPRDPSCMEHCQYIYDFSCESLEDLTLARVSTEKEIGLRCLLRKCKALKNLCLYYVHGVHDNDIVTLSNNCSNLRASAMVASYLVLYIYFCYRIRSYTLRSWIYKGAGLIYETGHARQKLTENRNRTELTGTKTELTETKKIRSAVRF